MASQRKQLNELQAKNESTQHSLNQATRDYTKKCSEKESTLMAMSEEEQVISKMKGRHQGLTNQINMMFSP
jgi:hypothetical protein